MMALRGHLYSESLLERLILLSCHAVIRSSKALHLAMHRNWYWSKPSTLCQTQLHLAFEG
jgi:hypothetical protein